MADGPNDLVPTPEVLENLGHILIRIEIERRATAAGHVNGVVNTQIDIGEFQRRLAPSDQRLVRQKPLADNVLLLHRLLEVGIAVLIPYDLAAVRTGEVDLNTALTEVPEGMRHFREPEGRFGTRHDK